jgi:hypothetical protein
MSSSGVSLECSLKSLAEEKLSDTQRNELSIVATLLMEGIFMGQLYYPQKGKKKEAKKCHKYKYKVSSTDDHYFEGWIHG